MMMHNDAPSEQRYNYINMMIRSVSVRCYHKDRACVSFSIYCTLLVDV
jgi:hypothetical protein